MINRAFPAWLTQHPWRAWLGGGTVLLLVSVAALTIVAPRVPPHAFHVREGDAVVMEPGMYYVQLRATDGVRLWVDDRLVIDQSAPGEHEYAAALDLVRGLHPIRVENSGSGFHLSWAPPSSREDFVDVPVLTPQNPPLTYDDVARAKAYPVVIAVVWSAWVASGLTLALFSLLRRLVAPDAWRGLRGWPMVLLALVAVVMLAWGVEIGAAPWRNWAPDELRPDELLYAASQWFSGGWSTLYPPVQFYLVDLVLSPFLVLAGLHRISLADDHTLETIHVLARCLSVLMALLTVFLTALLAEITVGSRRGVFAGAFLVAVPVFVFYSKTTNVDMPYVFWLALAMVVLVVALRSRRVSHYALLGGVVALAVATKDQAYGFFAGAAVALVWSIMREAPADWGCPRRIVFAFRDRRLWAGLLVCALVYVFAIGLLWNPAGVSEHVRRVLVGPQTFRMYPRTPAGIVDVVMMSLVVLSSTLGPVVVVFALIGLTVAIAKPKAHRELLVLLALLASYLATFVAIVGYVYDRFLLGFAVAAAVFAALGLDVTLRTIRHRGLRATAAAAAILLALLPAITLNWRVVADSRRQVEQWMVANLTADPFIHAVGLRMYLPNLYAYRHELAMDANAARMLQHDPDVVLINEQYLTRTGRRGARDVLRALSDAGYKEVFAAGGTAAEPRWVRIARFGTAMDPMFSNLEKIDPPLRVWRRGQ